MPKQPKLTKKTQFLISSLQRLVTRKSWEFTFLRYLSLKDNTYKLNRHEVSALQLLGHKYKHILGDEYHTCDEVCESYRPARKRVKAELTPLFDTRKYRGDIGAWGEGTDVKLEV